MSSKNPKTHRFVDCQQSPNKLWALFQSSAAGSPCLMCVSAVPNNPKWFGTWVLIGTHLSQCLTITQTCTTQNALVYHHRKTTQFPHFLVSLRFSMRHTNININITYIQYIQQQTREKLCVARAVRVKYSFQQSARVARGVKQPRMMRTRNEPNKLRRSNGRAASKATYSQKTTQTDLYGIREWCVCVSVCVRQVYLEYTMTTGVQRLSDWKGVFEREPERDKSNRVLESDVTE